MERSNGSARWVGAVAATLLAGSAAATVVDACTAEADDARRLQCYDRLFRQPAAPVAPETVPVLVPVGPAPAPTPVALGPVGQSAATLFWVLDDERKSELFTVRTYHPNYVLPVHYTSSINRAPYSPTRGSTEPNTSYRPLEAKMQISLRTKVAHDLLLPDADLWAAFTQRSLWQVWNPDDSSPFRSSDYEPEAIYVVPVPPSLGALPWGWQWRLMQLGVAHQSNGQAKPLSRSWNRTYLGAAFENGEYVLQFRAHRRWDESGDDDDNPDLTDYIGRSEIQLSWVPGRAIASLTARNNLRSFKHGSLQLDWNYPVRAEWPGLRWYVQLFSGYGETLLDYNHRQTSLGLGLTLFSF
jgi:phospholipase A1